MTHPLWPCSSCAAATSLSAMSLTSIVNARNASGPIFLTPTKRKRASPEPRSTLPSTADIYAWVLTSGAIAPCFICDIRLMKRHKKQGEEFWWLKRIPCRMVQIFGTVVGVQPYEKRISYTIDDGTSIIECIHQCGAAPAPSPRKQAKRRPGFLDDSLLPKPVAWVGHTVEVVGRIHEFNTKDSEQSYDREPKQPRRQLKVLKIVKCDSVNDKLNHWQTVLDLHTNSYSSLEPFRLPETLVSASSSSGTSTTSDVFFSPRPSSVISTPSEVLSSPYSVSLQTSSSSEALSSPATILSTPSSTLSTPSSTLSTPSTILSTPSTTLSTPSSTNSSPNSAPNKLRHPSRLHTADLTKHTFRFYLKHVMDHPPISEQLNDPFVEAPTPTKPPIPRIWPGMDADATPRPTRSFASQLLSGDPYSFQSSSLKGFTLSYLRRVPELAELAEKVARADAKRRDREATKKLKEAVRSQRQRPQGRSGEPPGASVASARQSLSNRISQLWEDAIVELCEDGEIVLWDGPTFPIGCFNWRIWRSGSTTSGNTTVRSDMSSISSVEGDEDIDLPDPDPNEDAYIVLTPEVLVDHIERVIHNWITRGRSGGTPKFTAGGILQALKRDDRWRRVGNWHVKDAMRVLAVRGLVEPISDERWSLSQGQGKGSMS